MKETTREKRISTCKAQFEIDPAYSRAGQHAEAGQPEITINVPVVFMVRYVMILRGATSLRGALEGVGPENRDFFGPKKVEYQAIKTTRTLVVLCTRVLLCSVVVCCGVSLCVVVCCCA